MKRIYRRKVFVTLVLAGVVVAAGIGIAAWNTTGSGTGYAKARTASSLTLGDASASTTADLYPGGTGAVKISVTNPNPFPVTITTVSQQASSSITSDKGAACNASTGVTFSTQAGLSLALAGGATSTFTLNAAVSMSNASDNSCQGAVFSIPVDVTAVSS
jgi:HAMP domain-containing protein